MQQTSREGSASAFDPSNKIVGVIDDPHDAQAALSDLMATGFAVKDVELLTNEEGAQRIDVGDDVLIHIFDPAQNVPAFYDAPVIATRVEQELRAGRYLIGVAAKDAEVRARTLDILKSHGGHFINFYGPWMAQALEP